MTKLQAGLGISIAKDVGAAVREAAAQAREALGGLKPSLAVLTATVERPAAELFTAVRRELPDVAIHGITTSLGVLGADGISNGDHGVVGLLLLAGTADVSFAVGSAPVDKDGFASGKAAALKIAQRMPGAKPAVIIFNASPGLEEDALEGVAEVFPGVPAYGGSAADNAIAGEWSVFTNDGPLPSAVSLAAVFGPVTVGGAFLAPYTATETTARVTLVSGRTLVTLDGKPAGEVLGGWLGSAVAPQLKHGGNILAQTALKPLGVRRTDDHFVTIHPAQIEVPGQRVSVFAKVRAGDTLCLMGSSENALIGAIPALLEQALRNGKLSLPEVRAGILIYCAGCAGAVGARLDAGLKEHVRKYLGGVPLLGMCTFGEQGYVNGVGNLHQNLTLGLLLLGEKR